VRRGRLVVDVDDGEAEAIVEVGVAELPDVVDRAGRQAGGAADEQRQVVAGPRGRWGVVGHGGHRGGRGRRRRPISTRSVSDRSPMILRSGAGRRRTSVGMARMSSLRARPGCSMRSMTSISWRSGRCSSHSF
jgi:hypothetical protein